MRGKGWVSLAELAKETGAEIEDVGRLTAMSPLVDRHFVMDRGETQVRLR